MKKTARQVLYDAWRKVNKGWNKGESLRCVCGDPITFFGGPHAEIGPGRSHFSSSNREHKVRIASWCMPGAIGHASDHDYDSKGYTGAIDAAIKALAKRTKKKANFDILVAWNDSKQRKKNDVLSLLKEARKHVEK